MQQRKVRAAQAALPFFVRTPLSDHVFSSPTVPTIKDSLSQQVSPGDKVKVKVTGRNLCRKCVFTVRASNNLRLEPSSTKFLGTDQVSFRLALPTSLVGETIGVSV